MNKQQFEEFWEKNYPETPPINYFFQQKLHDRWLRIHSLHQSKRYANTKEEWDELFLRQHTVINDLIPHNTEIQVVINFIEIDSFLFKLYDFENIGVFVDSENETVFQSFCFKTNWQTNCLDQLLKEVANDNVRAFIIGPNCLISPYDGGMNIIYQNTEIRDFHKNKYKAWLSKRADGF